MQFRIDTPVLELYPNLLVGVLVCKRLRNGPAPAELTELLRQVAANVRASYANADELKTDPAVVAWQEAHRDFGSNPNKFPPSVHALLKRVVKGGELPAINALVDAYNIVSLRHRLPVGGEDLDRCAGDIVLTRAQGSEDFVPLGESNSAPPQAGEVIYRDDAGVLCRKFNWREAARTCLTEATVNAVLVIEALPPAGPAQLDAAINDLRELTTRFCGGSSVAAVLRQEVLSFSFEPHGLS